MLGVIDHWFCTELPTPRAASASALAASLVAAGVNPDQGKEGGIQTYLSPAEAYQNALSRAGEGDRIVVFGSFYTVAGVMAYRNNQAH
jgi:dihydrofolate synthase / folylpolyglutamate synthase